MISIQPTWLNEIRTVLLHDVEALANRELVNQGHPDWEEKDQLLYFQKRLFIPMTAGIQRQLLDEAHSVPTAGHPGINRTISKLSSHYYWRELKQDVRSYVSHCDLCQRTKAVRWQPAGLL